MEGNVGEGELGEEINEILIEDVVTRLTRARICKPFKEPRNQFSAYLTGLYDNPICSTGPPGYIGWRNQILGIDSWAP
jgi:hypothetical protein